MRELSPHARIYMVLVVLAGYLALGQLFHQSPSPSASTFAVLLLLAITCGPLQVRIPRLVIGRSTLVQAERAGAGLWLLFVFAALIELPPRYAAIVSMVGVISESVFLPPAQARLT